MRFSSREEHRIQTLYYRGSALFWAPPPCSRALIKAKYLKVGLLRDEEVDLRQWQVLLNKLFFQLLETKDLAVGALSACELIWSLIFPLPAFIWTHHHQMAGPCNIIIAKSIHSFALLSSGQVSQDVKKIVGLSNSGGQLGPNYFALKLSDSKLTRQHWFCFFHVYDQ